MQEIGEVPRLSAGLTKRCVFAYVYTSGSLSEQTPESPGSLDKPRRLGLAEFWIQYVFSRSGVGSQHLHS